MHRIAVFLLMLLISFVSHAASSSKAGSCEVQCGQALSRCEHKLGPAGNCARRHSNCNQECLHGKPKDTRSSKRRAHDLCAQRCDLNRSVCEESNPNAWQHCVAGQQTCIERCR